MTQAEEGADAQGRFNQAERGGRAETTDQGSRFRHGVIRCIAGLLVFEVMGFPSEGVLDDYTSRSLDLKKYIRNRLY